jgi:SP family general alpha glucoside:H+ symporter-like MFS transporter
VTGIIVSVAFESRPNCIKVGTPSTRLRVRIVVLVRNVYNTASIVTDLLNSSILNPSAWSLERKGGFIWMGFCFLSLA